MDEDEKKPLTDSEVAQNLFDQQNRQYWGGRLPRYKVLITDKCAGCQCEKRRRTIFVNPHSDQPLLVLLLHEMAHAAVGYGHGKVFLDEIKRLVELGAPLQEELQRLAARGDTERDILEEFFQAGMEWPADWAAVRQQLGYKYGLTDEYGHPANSQCVNLLRRARSKWREGRALAPDSNE